MAAYSRITESSYFSRGLWYIQLASSISLHLHSLFDNPQALRSIMIQETRFITVLLKPDTQRVTAAYHGELA